MFKVPESFQKEVTEGKQVCYFLRNYQLRHGSFQCEFSRSAFDCKNIKGATLKCLVEHNSDSLWVGKQYYLKGLQKINLNEGQIYIADEIILSHK